MTHRNSFRHLPSGSKWAGLATILVLSACGLGGPTNAQDPSESLSAEQAAKAAQNCADNPPDDRYTCEEQATWSKCGEPWMKGYCNLSCGRCGHACSDLAPDRQSTCQQQLDWGKCDEPWMKGYCNRTCGRCDSGDSLDGSTGPSEPNAGLEELPLSAMHLRIVKDAIDVQGQAAGQGHAVKHVHVESYQSSPALEKDATNALLGAVLFANLKERKYATQAAAILGNWAKMQTTFSGANGFLVSAWEVGAMTRAAQVLKDHQAPEWTAIAPSFQAWARRVAESYWMPAGERLPGTNPELLNQWELDNVSNRTMTALEATMHVAKLLGERDWFDKGVILYKDLVDYEGLDRDLPNRKRDASFNRFFLEANGKNADDSRGDPWHRQAGLASCVQICQMASEMLDPAGSPYDLYPLHDNIVKKSCEYYAPKVQDQYIPFWDVAYRHYASEGISMPNTKNLLERPKGNYWTNTVHAVYDKLWGFGTYQ